MLKPILLGVFAAWISTSAALAASDAEHPHQMHWPFDGVFGTFDEPSIQRGFQVYREVCSACHGIKRIPFRSFTDIGFSEDEVKALAQEYTVMDGPNDDGEMYERPARPSDYFPSPYANEKAARAVNNGAYPVDLSLIVKARGDGANYLFSLLTGYKDAPEGYELGDGQYYNPYFPGGALSMAPPLVMSGQVEYQDGTEATKEQMARDVVNFLQWAAEPEMQDRKRMGVRVILFLAIMTLFFYLAKKRIWARLEK